MKKGFTLIELMATIVILAMLALILVPTIQNIISSAKKSAFKSSVYGVMDSASNYIGSQIMTNLGDVMPTEFTCNGTSCSDSKYSLEFNGAIPTGGTITVNSEEDIYVTFLTDGHYCASGSKENLRVADNCNYLDTTGPVISDTKDYSMQSTSSSVKVIIPNGYAYDLESGISKYRIEAYNNGVLEKTIEVLSSERDIEGIVEGLKKNTTYKINVVAINGNNMEIARDKEITTNDITNPTISVVDSSSVSNGYTSKEELSIDYTTNIENPIYYVKSTRAGISNIEISSSCGNSNSPSSCSDIESITNIESNVWYKVKSNISITYSEAIDESGTLYGAVSDGVNYGTVTSVISKIDKEKPTISNSVNGKVATLTLNDSKSGVSSYCVVTSDDSSSCSWVIITNSLSTSVDWTAPSANTYYAFTKDASNNISVSTSFNVPISAFNYDATLTCGSGRTLTSDGNCTYTYTSNSTMCGCATYNTCQTSACGTSTRSEGYSYDCSFSYCLNQGYDANGNWVCNGGWGWAQKSCTGTHDVTVTNSCATSACGCAVGNTCTLTENSYKTYVCPDGGTLSGTTCVR